VRFLEVGPVAVDRTAIAVFIEDAAPTLVADVHANAFEQGLHIKLVCSGPQRIVHRQGDGEWCR